MNKHLISTLCLVLVGNLGFACQVPVFRYALENWEPDRLTVTVLESSATASQSEALITMLRAAADAADEKVNLQVRRIDVSATHPAGSLEAHYAEQWKDKALPHMLVFFANHALEPHIAWSGPMSLETTQALLASPKRKQVVERLLDGQTAVWVLLKSGHQEADERAERMLREELAKKPNEIELPSLTDLAAEEQFNELLPVEMRVEFSLITIAPDETGEAFFREMLLNTERDLKEFNAEPIAIPVYGRGRTYFALVGAGINADNIADNCNFICGACSCEVKRDNPGQDLLLAANWNRVQPGNWVNDTPLPALTGIGGFDAMNEVASKLAEPSEAKVRPSAAGQALVETPAIVADEATDDRIAVTPSAASAESVVAAHSEDATWHHLIVLLVGWGGALFGIGLVFTLWRRTRNTE